MTKVEKILISLIIIGLFSITSIAMLMLTDIIETNTKIIVYTSIVTMLSVCALALKMILGGE